MRASRSKRFEPVYTAEATATAAQTTTVLTDTRIEAGDSVLITPKNASAAALEGGATGVYAAVTANTVTITHASAAGGEKWHVVVFAQS